MLKSFEFLLSRPSNLIFAEMVHLVMRQLDQSQIRIKLKFGPKTIFGPKLKNRASI